MNSSLETTAATEINRLHSELCGLARTSLEKAIRIGELLTEQKAKLKHGEWLPWVKENLEFSDETARKYIQLWKRRDEIPSHLEFGIERAYRLLSEPAKHIDSEVLPQGNPTAQQRPDITQFSDKEIFARSVELRKQRQESQQKKLGKALEIPRALHPLETEGRKLRLLHHVQAKRLMLVLGPNEAGAKFPGWWLECKNTLNYSQAEALQDEAAELESLAADLRKQAEEARETVRQAACDSFVKAHGTPIHWVETLDLEATPDLLAKLPQHGAPQRLLELLNSGEVKPVENGYWGDLTLPIKLPMQPAGDGWTKVGSPDWLQDIPVA